jgi:hypothetical protein
MSSRFSFGAKDGSKNTKPFFHSHTIDYDRISKIVMTVSKSNEPYLEHLSFYDMDGKEKGMGCLDHTDRKIEVNLELGERIIGIKKSDKSNSYVHDLQFIIARR